MKQPKPLSLEEIETRIHLYRDESRTISHRVDALTDRRKETQMLLDYADGVVRQDVKIANPSP